MDNLYAYGPPHGHRLAESIESNPTSAKAATRAAMTAELLDAHGADWRIEVTIGRASDYFGPGTTRSALGESVFGAALNGGRAQVMGDPGTLHSYSYTPDVASRVDHPRHRSRRRRAHLAPPRRRRPAPPRSSSSRSMPWPDIARGCWPLGTPASRFLGVVMPALREYRHTLYQFTDPWVVDDSAYRTAFGGHATPLSDALAATVDWYRGRAVVPVP